MYLIEKIIISNQENNKTNTQINTLQLLDGTYSVLILARQPSQSVRFEQTLT